MDVLPESPGVYKIFFLDPNLFYIGSSIDVRTRCREHLKHLRQGKHHNIHLQRAYAIHGIDAIHFEVVEIVERKEDLIVREQFYLDSLQPYYNIHPDARSPLGIKRSPKTRAKLSALQKGKPPWNKGKPWSPEMKTKLSAAHKGKPLDSDRLAKLIASHTGKPGWSKGIPSWNKGKILSKTHKQNLSKSLMGRVSPTKGRKLSKPSSRKGTHLSPEARTRVCEKNRATWAKKGSEARRQAVEKRRATMAAKKTLKQASLWDDTSLQ